MYIQFGETELSKTTERVSRQLEDRKRNNELSSNVKELLEIIYDKEYGKIQGSDSVLNVHVKDNQRCFFDVVSDSDNLYITVSKVMFFNPVELSVTIPLLVDISIDFESMLSTEIAYCIEITSAMIEMCRTTVGSRFHVQNQ